MNSFQTQRGGKLGKSEFSADLVKFRGEEEEFSANNCCWNQSWHCSNARPDQRLKSRANKGFQRFIGTKRAKWHVLSHPLVEQAKMIPTSKRPVSKTMSRVNAADKCRRVHAESDNVCDQIRSKRPGPDLSRIPL
jgi:hypothetical protein